MKTSKEKYKALVEANEDICIYNKPFWLDAVCGEDNWDAVVIERNGEIVAAVPYHMKKRFGIRCVLEPQLTQRLDIVMKSKNSLKYERQLSYQFNVIEEVAEKLLEVKADYLDQMLSGKPDTWLPFCWKGFHQETRYTFLIEAGHSHEELWQQMSSKQKNEIAQAMERASVVEINDIDTFYRYQSFAYSCRGMKNPVSRELVERLYYACKEHNACKMLAVKVDGDICCVGLYVCDNRFIYEILTGTDPEKKSLNCKSLMTYEMMKTAMDTGRGFDFEGSMVKSIAEHNRRYGAVVIPYNHVWKMNTGNILKRWALKRKFRNDRS